MPELMTAQEAADLLRLSRRRLYDLAARGALPGRKIGRSWRFHRESILQLVRGTDKETK